MGRGGAALGEEVKVDVLEGVRTHEIGLHEAQRPRGPRGDGAIATLANPAHLLHQAVDR